MKLKRVLTMAAPLLFAAGITAAPVLAQEDASALIEPSANNACLLPPPPPVTQGNPVIVASWTTAGWTITFNDRARNWHGEQYGYSLADLADGVEHLFMEYKTAVPHTPVPYN